MDFIVNNLPILICALVGIGLLIVEVFMPGFGVPGLAGIALLAASAVFTWQQHGPIAGLGVTVVNLALVGLAFYISFRSAAKGRLSRSPLILKGGQTREEGFIASQPKPGLVGSVGFAYTVLRPAGIAEFDGERFNVVSAGDFIPKDAKVVVKEVEGARVLVEQVRA